MIEVLAGNLAKSMTVLASVVERKSTVPVLSNVSIAANKTGLELTVTDLDIWCTDLVQMEGSAKSVKAFRTTASAQKLAEIAKAIPAEAVITIEYSDGKLRITALPDLAGGSGIVYDLETLSVDDFPAHSDVALFSQFEIGSADFRTMLEAVGFAMSCEETRYYLNGILFHERDGYFVVVATDGHRMAERRMKASADMKAMPDVIVSRKTVKLLAGLLAKEKGPVSVCVAPRANTYEIGSITVWAKNIDGTFPDYRRVVPKDSENPVRLDPVRLASAIKRVAVIASEKTRAVRFSLSKNSIDLCVLSPENGGAREQITVEYDGEDLNIGFNAKYLVEQLSHLPGDACEVHFGDQSAPALWRLSPDSAAKYVLMPMRV